MQKSTYYHYLLVAISALSCNPIRNLQHLGGIKEVAASAALFLGLRLQRQNWFCEDHHDLSGGMRRAFGEGEGRLKGAILILH